MRYVELSILIMGTLILSSCGNLFYPTTSPEPLSSSVQEKTSTDFEGVRAAIFSARCVSCHQQYDSYQGVIRELTAIQDAVATNRMPKTGGPLSDDQKALLARWIAEGARENPQEPAPPAKPIQLEANWQSISENILVPKCLICHNPQGQAKFLDLSSRNQIFADRNRLFGGSKLIDFDSPTESYLMQVIQDTEEPMPPVWSSIPRLSEIEVNALIQWISLGLP
jgi:mono/diheme cytochrome c family protein